MLDIVVAAPLLALLLPVWIVAAALLAVGVVRLRRRTFVGRDGWFVGRAWDRRRAPDGELPEKGNLAPAPTFLAGTPLLWNVLRGDMALIGPRPVTPGDPLLNAVGAERRCDVRPGLACLWSLRRRANIDFGTELASDLEYVARRGLRTDLGILARAVATAPFGARRDVAAEVVIQGLRIDNWSMAEAVADVVRSAGGESPTQYCFLNADCVNIAHRDAEYRGVLRAAPRVFADGIGLKLAGRWLGRDIRQNLCGTDLFPLLCEAIQHTPHGLFLLGARPGVAEAVARWVRERYPGAQVRGWRDGYFTAEEEPRVLGEIAGSGADILLVAFGAPRQDIWLARNLAASGCRVGMGVGGLFDFYSGRIPRAPQWMRELCLEWLYRLLREPGRLWRRYVVGNGAFLFRVAREKLLGPPRW
jgi:N-acetylglucosaminyldiphosphoundecaprenol N-acetyl-beta-D-mannosaminyltransferase